MSIEIITDSACDITQEEAKAMGITVMPLSIIFDGVEYTDGIDLDHEGFFKKLIESNTLPTTCQITPYAYEERYKEYVAKGNEVVVIVLSSKLSGCYQSACIGAADLEGIHVVDSENACIGQRILVERAIQLRDNGLSAAEIEEQLNIEKKNIRLIALLDTLEYLKKGGRISSAVAIAGSLLSIKPVIAIKDGAVALLGTARGSKQSNNKLKELISKEGGIDFSRPFCLAYSGLSRTMLDKYIQDSSELYEGHTDDLPVSSIGCAIGTHAGPGAIAAAFFVK